jgi:hypothetical protein
MGWFIPFPHLDIMPFSLRKRFQHFVFATEIYIIYISFELFWQCGTCFSFYCFSIVHIWLNKSKKPFCSEFLKNKNLALETISRTRSLPKKNPTPFQVLMFSYMQQRAVRYSYPALSSPFKSNNFEIKCCKCR